MIRKTNMTDLSLRFHFFQKFERTQSLIRWQMFFFHTMKKIKIKVVNTSRFERLIKDPLHVFFVFKLPCRQLVSQRERSARILFDQRFPDRVFASRIRIRRIKVRKTAVHKMIDHVLHLRQIDRPAFVFWQTHQAKTKF